jgi:hypothetical protein
MTYTEIFNLIDTNLASGNQIQALKHRQVEHEILDYVQANISQSGDIKRIKCDLTYYNANFDTNGLGKNLRIGWAVCNGNNGTDNLAGRVGVGYGIGYSTFGAIGGSKDAVVVEHNHTIGIKNIDTTGNNIADAQTGSTTGTAQTNTTGVSGIDKNMQPYIVNLYIMKL